MTKPPDGWLVWTCEGDGNNVRTIATNEIGADAAARTHVLHWRTPDYVAYVGHVTWKRVYRPADPLVVASDVEEEEPDV